VTAGRPGPRFLLAASMNRPGALPVSRPMGLARISGFTLATAASIMAGVVRSQCTGSAKLARAGGRRGGVLGEREGLGLRMRESQRQPGRRGSRGTGPDDWAGSGSYVPGRRLCDVRPGAALGAKAGGGRGGFPGGPARPPPVCRGPTGGAGAREPQGTRPRPGAGTGAVTGRIRAGGGPLIPRPAGAGPGEQPAQLVRGAR